MKSLSSSLRNRGLFPSSPVTEVSEGQVALAVAEPRSPAPLGQIRRNDRILLEGLPESFVLALREVEHETRIRSDAPIVCRPA